MKNKIKKKNLLSVTRQLIPCKTGLRENLQLSHCKYRNEALLDSSSREY